MPLQLAVFVIAQVPRKELREDGRLDELQRDHHTQLEYPGEATARLPHPVGPECGSAAGHPRSDSRRPAWLFASSAWSERVAPLEAQVFEGTIIDLVTTERVARARDSS